MDIIMVQNLSQTSNLTPDLKQDAFVWTSDRLLHATHVLQSYWTLSSFSQDLDQDLDQLLVKLHSQIITTDTRKIQAGDIFLALKGEQFDGHDYAKTAIQKGAAALILQKKIDFSQEADIAAKAIKIPQLIVSDTRLALGVLGAYRRRQHPDLTLIALTGSSGKTTTKEMLGSILNQIAPTLITAGNLNNDLGVPMMLLRLLDSQRYAVLELGANHLGEIDYTSRLVEPKVAGILNIGSAHLGEFGGQNNIFLAKSEIFNALKADSSTAVIPNTGEFANQLYQIAQDHAKKIIGFGDPMSSAQTLYTQNLYADRIQTFADASEFLLTVQDFSDKHAPTQTQQAIRLPFAGEHNIQNALAAASFALAVGVDLPTIATGLAQAKPAKGRLNAHTLGKITIIDDTYNANPHSVKAAAQVLAHHQGKKILILGDIAELGDHAHSEHFALGQDLAQHMAQNPPAFDALWSVGELMQDCHQGALQILPDQNRLHHFATKADLLTALKDHLSGSNEAITLLFKGSRSMQMETLIQDLGTN